MLRGTGTRERATLGVRKWYVSMNIISFSPFFIPFLPSFETNPISGEEQGRAQTERHRNLQPKTNWATGRPLAPGPHRVSSGRAGKVPNEQH